MGQSAFNKNLVSSWYLFLPFAFFSCLTFKSRIRLNKTAVRLNSICGTIDSSSRGAKKRDAFWYAMISDLKGCVLFPNRCSAIDEILTSTMIIHMQDLLSTDYGHPMKALIKDTWKIGPMLQTKYLDIWEWEWIFGRAVKAISYMDVCATTCNPQIHNTVSISTVPGLTWFFSTGNSTDSSI